MAANEELYTSLFYGLVLQYSNLAMVGLGKLMNPETGESHRDLEMAKAFIDTLEMLHAKTKGNLTDQEKRFLDSTLTQLRLNYVHEVEHPTPETPAPKEAEPARETSSE